MKAEKLSKYYSIATERVHDTLVDFYESCHDDRGNPITEKEKIKDLIEVTMKSMSHELDLCLEAVKEYNNE